jgi:hypothetical protein
MGTLKHQASNGQIPKIRSVEQPILQWVNGCHLMVFRVMADLSLLQHFKGLTGLEGQAVISFKKTFLITKTRVLLMRR